MKTESSDAFFTRALGIIPGGVNSPVRAFKSVGRHPLFIRDARGSKIRDVDGNEFIDYVGSWGPMILGHAHPTVIDAVKRAADLGTSYGAPTELEIVLAERISACMPWVEMVRMVNSGTEATMSAIRLARAYTKRNKIIKFEGCYHGHGDSFLIRAGSGAMTLGVPDSPGVPPSVASDTLTARYNDLPSVEALIAGNPGAIAAVIVEPVVGNMGCVPPRAGFLQGLRTLCTRHEIVLIMDEVMTGFRLALGGAGELYGVHGDLVTLGKIIGGGLPVGAYGGKTEMMEMVAPSGPVYQAGTLSGNPLAMAAGNAMLSLLENDPSIYQQLEKRGCTLAKGLQHLIDDGELPLRINRVGSMFTLFFTSGEVTDYESAKRSDTARFAAFYNGMLEESVYLPPSQFEAAFISAAHTDDDIDKTVAAAGIVLKKIF